MVTRASSPYPKPPIFGPYLLRPNGCMDQDATWYEGTPRPRRLCLRPRWGPSSPSYEGHRPNFRPMSVVAKRLDGLKCHLVWRQTSAQATLCRWGRSPHKRGTAPPQFSVHVCCGQAVVWMKIPLGTEVELGPGHIVLDGVPALRRERGAAVPLFSAHVYFGHGRPSQLLLSCCSTFWYLGHPLTSTEKFHKDRPRCR